MTRILGVVLLVGVASLVANADVIVEKKGRGARINGLDKKIGDEEVTADNWRIYLPKSEGVIVELNYDSIVWKKNTKTKKTASIPMADVIEYAFRPGQRHEGIDQGAGALSSGNLAAAIGDYKSVLEDPEALPADKAEANFQIGYAYLAFGRVKSAERHFANWNGGKSIWTPEVYRLLAEINTAGKKYDDAVANYKRIMDLPGIPDSWKLRGEAGLVKVMIAQRDFGKAEKEAARIAGSAAKNEDLNDSRALAIGLQAQAIIASQAADRLPEAEKLLVGGLELTGISSTNAAFLNATLGDSIYAQGRIEDARFPYMRVVELYPDERGYVAHGLLNAGNCFIDMATRAKDAGNDDDYKEFLKKGMGLINICGTKYKGTDAARQASGVWRKNKKAYNAIK